MWAGKGIIGKAIAIVISGSGVGMLGINNLGAGGGSNKVRSVNIKAGGGQEIYKLAEKNGGHLNEGKGNGAGRGVFSSEGKRKGTGKWKYFVSGEEKYGIGGEGNKCGGLVVKNKGRWGVGSKIEGKGEGEKCKLEYKKDREIKMGTESLKREDISIKWLR